VSNNVVTVTPNNSLERATGLRPVWMAWASLVIGLYTAVCALLIFLTRAFVVGPVVIVGIILGIWHLFRSSRLRKSAYLGIGLCVGGLALFSYGHHARMERLEAAMTRWTGYSSPPLRLTALDGTLIDSNGFKGKRVLLNFWATWCPPCIKEVKDISAFVSATSRDDILVVGISDEDRTVLEPFMKVHAINYPVVSIPREQLPMPYSGRKAIPVSFILDRKGTIQFVKHGAISEEQLTLLVKDSEDFAGVPKRIVTAEVPPKPEAR
jgi:peroxiredoxin